MSVAIWTNQLNASPWSEVRDAVQELDELGFAALWCGESARGREAFTHAVSVLAVTQRITVATGIASIWARDASTAASARRLLCEAHPGRFVLGLGVGHGAGVVNGQDRSRPVAAMREYVAAMDAAPTDLPPATGPRVLGAMGPAMLRLARDAADGAHPFMVTPEQTAVAREVLGEGKLLVPEQGVVLERDPDRARAVLRRDMAVRLRLPRYRASLLRMGFAETDLDAGGSDRLIDAMYVWGDEVAVARRVAEHLGAGADQVALYVLHEDGPRPPRSQWRRLAALVDAF